MSSNKEIHDILLKEIFQYKGGKLFTSLSGKDIEKTFYVYDDYIFGGQIREKLKSENAYVRFFAKSRVTGVGGICGLKGASSERCEYYIDVAPTVVYNLTKSGLCSDRIYCFQMILEYEIVHVIMMLWGYLDKNIPYDKLYKCLLREIFGYTKYIHGLIGITKPHRRPFDPGLMVNWSGSCYMDSLITALFLCSTEYFRENIFNIDPHTIDYKGWSAKDLEKPLSQRGPRDVFHKICHSTSKIDTEPKMREYTSRLQRALREDYERVVSGSVPFKCTNLRKIFAECYPDLIPFGDYNVSEIYSALTDIFPRIKIRDVPTSRKEKITEKSMFQMWDYMDPEMEGEVVLWNKIDSAVLVFQNGLVPPIHNYDSLKPESIHTLGPIPGEYTYTTRVVKGSRVKVRVPQLGRFTSIQTKARAFGEYIIHGKYRLCAAVMIMGPRPRSLEEWGGGHYISYVRPFFDPGRWYYYNDLGPTWSLVGTIPKDIIFRDQSNQRPEILFYEKVRFSSDVKKG